MLKLMLKLFQGKTKTYEIPSAELCLTARDKNLFLRRELIRGRDPVWKDRGKRT